MPGDRVRARARPRQLDHRADRVVLARNQPLAASNAVDELSHQFELVLIVDERDHDLRVRRLGRRLGRPQDRLDLHLVDLRVEDPEPAPAGPEHRVRLGDLLDSREQSLELLQLRGRLLIERGIDLRRDPCMLDLPREVGEVRQELVERRIEQADRDRKPLHLLE